MKKAFGFFIIGSMFFGACSAQNVNAQSVSDAQRIVGTWRGFLVPETERPCIFTFNSDDTFISSERLIKEYKTTRGIYFIGGLNSTGISNLFLKYNKLAGDYIIASFAISLGRW